MIERWFTVHDIKLSHCCCVLTDFVGKNQRHQSLFSFANLAKDLSIDPIDSLVLALVLTTFGTVSRVTADLWVDWWWKAWLLSFAFLSLPITLLAQSLLDPAPMRSYWHSQPQVMMSNLHMHKPFVVGTLKNELRKILYHFDSLVCSFCITADRQDYKCRYEYVQALSLPVIIVHINNPSQIKWQGYDGGRAMCWRLFPVFLSQLWLLRVGKWAHSWLWLPLLPVTS